MGDRERKVLLNMKKRILWNRDSLQKEIKREIHKAKRHYRQFLNHSSLCTWKGVEIMWDCCFWLCHRHLMPPNLYVMVKKVNSCIVSNVVGWILDFLTCRTHRVNRHFSDLTTVLVHHRAVFSLSSLIHLIHKQLHKRLWESVFLGTCKWHKCHEEISLMVLWRLIF